MPARLMGGTFEIHKGDCEGEFCFRLRTSGGSILMESVGVFNSKEAAERMIQAVSGIAGHAKVIDLTEDAAGSL
jgi:uncharacterized protein YegP (UPF0339 family)